MNFYVVRRTFKSNGVVYEVGQILRDEELVKIRRFKTKIKDRKLIRLSHDPRKKEKEVAFIESRSGLDLKEEIQKKKEEDGFEAEVESEPKPEPKPKPKPKPKPAGKKKKK